jgi:sigma-B regulation protein RsbU (phosphoserine phosphatase)
VNFSDPGEVLTGLNNAFPMEKHGEMFFTAWCGIYDPSTRRMRFAGGGHPPSILVRADGTTEILAAKGPVIGAMPGMKFASAEAVIPPAARLFVFSDGAYEIVRHDSSMMSHDDLRELLARAPQENAAAWAMEQLRALNSQPVFDDDVSLVELCFP